MTVDPHIITALTAALSKLKDQPHRPVPSSVIEALAPIARPGMKLKVDLNASHAIGAPLITLVEGQTSGPLLQKLTARQRQVASLVIAGKSNKIIAADLGISLATVKDHVHAILARLELPSRVALIAATR